MKKKIKLFFKSRRRVVVGFLVLVVLAGLMGRWLVGKTNQNKVTYQTSKAEKGTLITSVSASGTIISTGMLTISSNASGVVKKVYVKDGDMVFAGQKIAEIILDQSGLEKYASAYASYVQAQNAVNSANNNLRSAIASAEKVLDEVKGHDTDETFVQKESRTKAEVARDNAYDATKSATANLTVASHSLRLASSVITAPYSGKIDNLNLVEGLVMTETNVAVVRLDTSPVALVNLNETDISKIKIGQKVTLTADGLPEKTFVGVVSTIDRVGLITSNVVNYPVKVKLTNQTSELLPNMSVSVEIMTNVKTDVLLVSLSAVQTANNQSTAQVMKDGKPVTITVEVGLSNDFQTEIISGLSEGDEVVTSTVTTKNSSSSSSSSTSTSPFSGVSRSGGGFPGGGFRD
jgi:RND family efflux transporter MFP subunit